MSRGILLAVLIVSSSFILIASSTPNAFAEPLRCPSYGGYTEAQAYANMAGHSTGSPTELKMRNCLFEIADQVWSLVASSSPYSEFGAYGEDTCPSRGHTKAQAAQNIVAIDNQIEYLLANAPEWQISSDSRQSRLLDDRAEQRGCVDYFEKRDKDRETATEVGEQFGITEEEAKELIGEENAKKFYDSNCIIATAAFGSEIAPQVQFLRGFRDNHILSTAAGSSFMNVFNSWYYSFSPYVADYERGQPWMQASVRTAIQPLLAILTISEKGYSSMPGEFGAMSAGLVASAMIGAVYFSPIALSIKQVRKSSINYRLVAGIIAAISVALIASILSGNQAALMVTSASFVLGIIIISALIFAKVWVRIGSRISGFFNNAGKT